MSALPPKPDKYRTCRDVRFVPKADSSTAAIGDLFDHFVARASSEALACQDKGCERLMMVPGIGGCIRSRSAGWMRRCGGWEGRVDGRARTLVAYKDNKHAESQTAGTRRLQFMPDVREEVP